MYEEELTMSDIVVIGSFVADNVVTVKEFPKEGQTVLGDTFHVYLGGKGINQAVAARRAGCSVDMFGCIGNDSNGNAFLKLLEEEKIGLKGVKICSDIATSVAQIQINAAGENKIIVIPAANHAYDKKDLHDAEPYLKKAKMVLLQMELPQSINFETIEMCADLGIPVLLNPAPACPIPNSILNKIDYLTPNESELEILTGKKSSTLESVEGASQKLLDCGVKSVLVTLGKRGVYLSTNSQKKLFKGHSVNAVDTVGAGDCFNGVFASYLVRGKTIEEAIMAANAAAALSVTKHGSTPSFPYEEQINKYMQS